MLRYSLPLLLACAQADTVPINWVAGFSSAAARVAESMPGDALVFSRVSGHDVYQMASEAALKACDFSAATFIGRSSTTTYSIPSDASGELYFACSVGSHCKNGQHLTVSLPAPVAPVLEFTPQCPSPLCFCEEGSSIMMGVDAKGCETCECSAKAETMVEAEVVLEKKGGKGKKGKGKKGRGKKGKMGKGKGKNRKGRNARKGKLGKLKGKIGN